MDKSNNFLVNCEYTSFGGKMANYIIEAKCCDLKDGSGTFCSVLSVFFNKPNSSTDVHKSLPLIFIDKNNKPFSNDDKY